MYFGGTSGLVHTLADTHSDTHIQINFWPKTMDYSLGIVHGFVLSALIIPHWKELWRSNLQYSAPLEMPFHIAAFSPEVKIFHF